MSYDRCWFVVRTRTPAEREEARARAEALRAFYAPAGAARLRLFDAADGAALVGCVGAREPEDGGGGLLAWGDVRPLTREDLLAAGDARMRAYRGPGAAVAWDDRGVRAATAAIDVTALYAAGDRAWSTHEVAAAFLAHGRARVRPAAAAELVAFGHVANDGGMLEGVRRVPAATVVDVVPAGGERSYWPADDRWALPREEDAAATAEAALLRELQERAAVQPLVLGLSAGLDSRVVAAGLRASGIGFRAFTWGAPDGEDAVGARAVASVLGVEHLVVPSELREPGEILRLAGGEARWLDGASALAIAGGAAEALPADAVVLTGVGGELGRAYHYRLTARNHRRPGHAQLRRLFRPQQRLPAGTDASVCAAVQAAADEALRAAEALPGVHGWRVLDVVYATQRMRRWTRSQMRLSTGATLPAFLDPPLAAALVALPLEDRLADGFHRAFIARHAPALVPAAAAPAQRRGVPAPLRRAAARLRGAPSPAAPDPLLLSGPIHAHLAGVVAPHPLVEAALGPAAALRLREGLETHEAAAVAAASHLVGPVALADAVALLHA